MSANENITDNESDNAEFSLEYDDALSDDDRINEVNTGKVGNDDLRDTAIKCLLKDQSDMHAGEDESRTVVKLNGVCASSGVVYMTDHFNRSVKRIRRKQAAELVGSPSEAAFHATERLGTKQTQFVGGCTLCADGGLLVCTVGTNRLLVLDVQTGAELQRLVIARPQREFHEAASCIFETADRDLLVAFRDTDLVFELRFDDVNQRYELALEPDALLSDDAASASASGNAKKSPKSAKLQLKTKSPNDASETRLAAIRLVDNQVVHSVRKRLFAFAYSRSLCYTVCVYTTHDAEICDRQFALAENVCFPARNAPEWQPTACLFVESVRTPFILFAMRAGPICAFTLEGRFAYRLVEDLAVTCWSILPLALIASDARPADEQFELVVFGFEKRKVETGQCSFGESQKLFTLCWSA